jgi:hypothetical protein
MAVPLSGMRVLLSGWRLSRDRRAEQEESRAGAPHCEGFRGRVEDGGGIGLASLCRRCMMSVVEGRAQSVWTIQRKRERSKSHDREII